MKSNLVKFLIKVVFFLFLLFVVDSGIGILFVGLKDYGLIKNPENMWLKTPFVLEKVNSDIIIIGSSKASHHYIPQLIEDSLRLSVYNCGQDGCFFLYQNCIINMILERYQPKCIIWDIQPESFTQVNKNFEYQNIRFLSPYYRNNKWAMEYINGESFMMKYRMKSNMFAYNSKVLNYIFPLFSKNDMTLNGYLPLPNKGYDYPMLVVEKESAYNSNLYFLEMLSNTIKRCVSLGVELHLFISPVLSEKSNASKSAELDIEAIATSHDISIHNYHSSKLFLDDVSLFKDMGHMNDKGAHLFTNQVICAIK